MGQSVISGDYSGGSGSSKKKANNIDGQDITIQDFKKIERNKSDLQNLSERVNNQFCLRILIGGWLASRHLSWISVVQPGASDNEIDNSKEEVISKQ